MSSNSSSSHLIPETNLQGLLAWASEDPDIKKLIQKSQIDGRVDQAINFANFMETFDQNTHAKSKYASKEKFYEFLRSKYNKKRENSGFSSSSCKRMKVEGDCYILLKKANETKFPQSQSIAMTLKGCSQPDNIAGIWKEALNLYDGDETCVHKRDIAVAVKNYAENRPAPPSIDRPDLSRVVADLTARAKRAEARLADESAARNAAELRLREVNPVFVVKQNFKKLDIYEECVRRIDQAVCLAYSRTSSQSAEVFKPVTVYADLQDMFRQNKMDANEGKPLTFDIKCLAADRDGIVTEIIMKDWDQWKNNVWKHLHAISLEVTEAVAEKDEEFGRLEVECAPCEEEGVSDVESDTD